MLTAENISLIREIYTQKSLSYYDDFSKVLEVTKLKDFYIKPDDNKIFVNALEKAMSLGKELGTRLFENNASSKASLNHCIQYTTSYLIILTIKVYLDYEYFNTQTERVRSIDPKDKEFLREQLFSLSKDELYYFIEILNNYNIDFKYVGEGHTYDMRRELDSACYNRDPSVQKINDETFTDFFCSTVDLFNEYRGTELEYISEKTFCEIVFKYIDNEFWQLARMCEILKASGYEAAVEFLSSCPPEKIMF